MSVNVGIDRSATGIFGCLRDCIGETADGEFILWFLGILHLLALWEGYLKKYKLNSLKVRERGRLIA